MNMENEKDEFNFEKIEEIKRQIKEGKFEVNYDVLVKKLEAGPLKDLLIKD